MLWILLVVVAALTVSISAFLDNFITDVTFKKNTPQAAKYFYGFAYLITALLIPLFFEINLPSVSNVFLLFLAGAVGSLASIPYYLALKSEEATSASIFLQLTSVLCLVFGWWFLGDKISFLQLAGFFVILLAPIVVFLFNNKHGRKMDRKAISLLSLHVILSAVGNLLFASSSSEEIFPTCLMIFLLGKAFFDIFASISVRKWRVRYKNVIKKNGWRAWLPMLLDHIAYIVYEIAYRLAMSIVPVALVSVSTSSIAIVATFVMGIILTIIWPKFGRETLNKKIILAHLIATILCVVGVFLMR